MHATRHLEIWPRIRAAGGKLYRDRIRRDVPILVIHRIREVDGTSLSTLCRVLDHCAEHHQVITLGELAATLRRGANLPRNAIVLTFDDCTSDHISLAASELRKRGLRATFAPIGCVLRDSLVPAVHWLLHILETTPRKSIRFGFPGLIEERTWPMGREHMPELLGSDSALRRTIQSAEYPLAVDMLFALGQAAGVAPPQAEDLFATVDDVKSLVADGHEVAGHSMLHRDVDEPDRDRWTSDLRESFDLISDLFGQKAHSYIYPFGHERSMSVHSIVKAAGFGCAATTEMGTNTRRTSPFALRRIGIHSDWPVPFPPVY